GDELIGVLLTAEGDDVVLSTRHGMAIRFEESRVRAMGRTATGVKGVDLQDDDEVVGGVVVVPSASLLTVCEKGYGKRTPFAEYRTQNRGGKGLIDIKTTERNGKVVGVAAVEDDDEVMIISYRGMVVRIRAADISVIGRNTQGVTVMRMHEDDHVVALAKIASEDLKEEGNADNGDDEGTPPSEPEEQPTPTEASDARQADDSDDDGEPQPTEPDDEA